MHAHVFSKQGVTQCFIPHMMFYFIIHGNIMPFHLSQKPHRVRMVIPKQPSAFDRMQAESSYVPLLGVCLPLTWRAPHHE